MNMTKAIGLAILAALIIGTGASYGARAQEAQQTPAATTAAKPESFDDWQLFCPEAKTAETKVCEMRTVMTGKDGRKLAALAVAAITQTQRKTSEVIISALVPLGVDLTQHPALKIDDGKVVDLNYLRCLQRGCEAMMPLTAEQQASMQSGTKARVAVGIGGGEKAVFEFSLKGFTTALAALKERTGVK